ncbi:hypothetical protein ABXT00_06955 [Stenotrophomonas koreensis]|uniref:hypothetical protein n=1 Tax=Stenotrophomonas koreensis TaxID=266128 RepID=UPI0033976905
MSFWSKIKGAHHETMENISIQNLQQNYGAFLNLLSALPPGRGEEAAEIFVSLASGFAPLMDNWSEEGALKIAKKLQEEARSEQHLNRSSAIAKGLVSVWIESHYRPGPHVAAIRVQLNRFIAIHADQEEVQNNQRSSPLADLEKQINQRQEKLADTYGYESTNPILCPSIMISMLYMRNLRYKGVSVNFEREGSISASNRIIDVYHVSGVGGFNTKLYVDAHAGDSAPFRLPNGFTAD